MIVIISSGNHRVFRCVKLSVCQINISTLRTLTADQRILA